MVAHRAAGGRAVLCVTSTSFWRKTVPTKPVASISTALRSRRWQATSQADTEWVLLFAVSAAAWAMGITPELIIAGIETSEQAPKPAR